MMILLQCQGKAAATPAEATGAVAAEEGEGAGRSATNKENHTTLLYKIKNWSNWLPSGYVKIAIEHTPFIVDLC